MIGGMNRLTYTALAAICSVPLLAADVAEPTANKIFDRDLTNIERDIVPLAEAMPADKYNFAPTQGSFKDVRTFGDQMKRHEFRYVRGARVRAVQALNLFYQSLWLGITHADYDDRLRLCRPGIGRVFFGFRS